MPSVHNAQARSLEGNGRDPVDFMSEAAWKRFQTVMDMVTRLIREETRLQKSQSQSEPGRGCSFQSGMRIF
jgi:hypothetical protein